MAHELTMNGARAEMAWVGETPWHGLGQQLTAGAPIDQWLVAAGMDWKVQRSKVRFATSEAEAAAGAPREWPDHHVLFRSDSKAPLGIVSDTYKVVQPRAVLEFFRDLTEGAGFQLETAGTLFGGRKYWALASIGAQAEIANRDRVGGYLLLSTSADGSSSTAARFTTVRVVCNNTLTMAVRGAKADIAVSHRSVFDPGAVKAQLGVGRTLFSGWVDSMRQLADTQLARAEAEDMTVALLRTGKTDADAVRESAGFTRVMDLFGGAGKGAQLDGVRGTAWGWVNAVTEYADWHVRARSQDNRLSSAWFGQGDALKARAVELAQAA